MTPTALPLHLATGPPPDRQPAPQPGNTLFPVFLKLEHLRVLLIGGDAAALDKLTELLRNSPATSITVVSEVISVEIRTLAAQHPAVQLHERAYQLTDLLGHDLVLVATPDQALGRRVRHEAAGHGLLTHVADRPEESDFDLGAIVQKGDLKVAISTNGKAPTVAQRLREVLSEALPDELNAVLQNLGALSGRLSGDFTRKVRSLSEVTAGLAESPETTMWRRIATFSLFGFALLLGLNVLSIYFTLPEVWHAVSHARTFYIFVAVGFAAQLVDGLLGMGYGVVTAISLMSLGLNPAAVSASIHTAEMFASGASGYNHYRFGNVNRRLFRALLIPGILGAVSGAFLLSKLGEEYAGYVKPVLAAYLLLLGVRLIGKAFTKPDLRQRRKVKYVGWLAGAGGFLDSFGGGGWGPLVTSTLISQGRTPQYVIGSVSLTEFFVTFASALTFFATIGISHWQVILGLIVGGVAAAPFAARLAGRISTRFMFLGVGLMVIIWSLWALRKVFF